MQNPCDEFNNMLCHFPTYSSWRVKELEVVFIRYRDIVLELIESEHYKRYSWLADHCPDLANRIQDMLLETETDKQSRQFNNIVFELRCAIELLMGSLDCDSQEEWAAMIARSLSGTA